MRLIHKLFGFLGFSLGGADACIKHGCATYCGYSPAELMRYIEQKVDDK